MAMPAAAVKALALLDRKEMLRPGSASQATMPLPH
jgi:hypothetical protein